MTKRKKEKERAEDRPREKEEEELEEENGEPLPDREVMSVISAPAPGGGAIWPPEHFSE